MSGEVYLGDGLYGRIDDRDGSLWLRAPREHGDHEVCLEPEVLMAALQLVRKFQPKMLDEILKRIRKPEAA